MNKSLTQGLVSIHMLTFNHERNIRLSLKSILNQTYKNWELIISDDGSNDNTVSIINEFLPLFKNKVIFNQNHKTIGITANSNKALSLCSGQYVCFITGDDFFKNTKLEKQINYFQSNSFVTLVGHECFNQGLYDVPLLLREFRKIYYKFHDLFHKKKGPSLWIRKGCLYESLSIMINRIYKPQINFDRRISIYSDMKLWVDILMPNYKYGYIPEKLATYVKTEKSTSNNLNFEKMLNVYKIMEQEKEYKYFKDDLKKGLFKNVIHANIITTMKSRPSLSYLLSSVLKNLRFYFFSPSSFFSLLFNFLFVILKKK